MKNWNLAGLTVLVLLSPSMAIAGAQKNTQAETMMAAARQKESVEGNLEAAIKQYKEIVSKYAKTDRVTAALALIRMADAYHRMADAEARRIYEQVVKDYPEQKEAVTVAQAKLGVGAPAGQISRTLLTANGLLGTLSRDGRFYSYRDRRDGDIFIHEIATGTARNVTNRPKESKDLVFESAISPDGTQLAYVWRTMHNTHYTVRLASLRGNPGPRPIYDPAEVSDLWLHDWSPDGKYLALSVQRADNSMQIGLVSVSDGSFYALKSLEWPGPGTMRFSPDGKYLAYDAPQAQTGSEKDIFILALDGSREFRSVSNESNDVLVGWSPDGKWLLFTSDRWGTTDLWGASVSDGKTIGQPLQLRSNIGAGFRPMGWTPFGALYYKTSQGGGDSTSRLQLASLDWNTGLLSSAPVGTRGYLENSSQSAWSPDGKSLAYLSTLRGRAGNESPLLAIRSVATGSTRELRPKQLSTIGVVEGWSPDGRALWVVANDTKGPELDLGDGLYRIDVETGDAVAVIQYDQYDPKIITRGMNWLPDGRSFITQRADRKPGGPPTAYVSYRVDAITGRMTPVGANEPPSRTSPLSPDGLIQYTRRPSPAQNGVAESVAFVKRNMTTGEETELIRRSFLGNIQLSPDGRYIGTASTDPASNSRVLLLIPVDGGEVRELMRVPAEVVGRVSVDWKSDSSAVLARINPTDQTKDAEFWLVPLNQSKPKRVEGGVPAGTAISVSPDRLHFTYTKIEEAPPSTQEIAVLENFLPKTAK